MEITAAALLVVPCVIVTLGVMPERSRESEMPSWLTFSAPIAEIAMGTS